MEDEIVNAGLYGLIGIAVFIIGNLVVGVATEVISGFMEHQADLEKRFRRRKRRTIERKKGVVINEAAKALATAIGAKFNVTEGNPLFDEIAEGIKVSMTDCERKCKAVKARR